MRHATRVTRPEPDDPPSRTDQHDRRAAVHTSSTRPAGSRARSYSMTAVDPQSARQIASRLASRRSFLRLAGLGVAGVGLAACSSGTTTATIVHARGHQRSRRQLQRGGIQRRRVGRVHRHRARARTAPSRCSCPGSRTSSSAASTSPTPRATTPRPASPQVDLVTGPVDSADALVAAGNVTVGISAPDATARFISEQGAPLKVIGSTFQKNPFCILSLEEGKPIKTVGRSGREEDRHPGRHQPADLRRASSRRTTSTRPRSPRSSCSTSRRR